MMMLKVGLLAHLPGRPPVATLPGLDVIVRHLLQLVLETTSFRQQRHDVIVVASVRWHVIAQLRCVSHPARHGIRRNETRRELSFFVLGGPCHKRGFLGHFEVLTAIPNSIRGVAPPPELTGAKHMALVLCFGDVIQMHAVHCTCGTRCTI